MAGGRELDPLTGLRGLAAFHVMIYHFFDPEGYYCLSKKKWPILHNNLLYKLGHYFLDKQYM